MKQTQQKPKSRNPNIKPGTTLHQLMTLTVRNAIEHLAERKVETKTHDQLPQGQETS